MKKSEQTVVKTINVKPNEAWKVIAAVTGVEKWLAPMITNSRVEGDQRICSTETGEFTENIKGVDHDNMVFNYEIPQQHLMPIENIVGQMKVTPAEDDQSTIQWNWKFDVKEENEEEAKNNLAMSGEMGIQGIENLILQN